MTTPAKVHIVIPSFAAITEFAGFHDDCGPCANEVCIAACERRAPVAAEMNAIRARDLAHQAPIFRAGNGQTLDELQEDVTTYTHIETTKTAFGSPLETIHQNLKAAILRGNPCVLNLALAGNLPGNESGIHYHFVAIGGIDDTLGYLVANGDEFPFSHVGTYWVRWSPGIVQAQPCGLLEYHLPTIPPPVTPPDVSPEVARLKTTLTNIEAAATAALKG